MPPKSAEPQPVAGPAGGAKRRMPVMNEMQSNVVQTGGPRRGSAANGLSQANVKLEQENARLRALLVQAGVDARHTAEATLEATVEATARASARALELAAIVASSSDAIISKKLDGTITSWNAAAGRLFGFTEEEMLGRSILPLIPSERLGEEEDILARVATGEIVQAFETVRMHKSGQPIEVSVTISPMFDGSREICGVSKIIRGIAKRKRAEAALRASEEFARTVLEASPDCLKVIGADGRLDYVNKNGACLLEVDDPSTILGRLWESLWPEASRPMIKEAIEAARAGRSIKLTAARPTAKGTPKHWDISIVPIPGEDGRPVRLLAAARDVTGNIQAEIALMESEARFRAAVEAVDGIVWTNNAAGEMRGEQPGWSALTGQTPAEYEGFGWSQALHPDDAQPTIEAWNAAVAARSLFEFEHRVRRRDGEWCHFSIRAVPIFDKENHIVEWVGVHTDISARKAAEAHRDLLMHELAHRSKNQLAVIQGVANQTARHACSIDQFREIFSKRLHGMAISADLLVAGQWDGASLGELVRRQLEPFGTEEGRLSFEGPDVLLSSDAAESIGLALHELATNCVKYGAWSAPAGVVRVSSTLDRNGAQPPQLRLNWTERGGPAANPPTREGFGRRVIEQLVAKKLGGTVELIFDVQGLSWSFIAPLTEIAEARPAGRGR